MDIKWNERVTIVSLNKLVLRGQVKLWNIAKTFKTEKKIHNFSSETQTRAEREKHIGR